MHFAKLTGIRQLHAINAKANFIQNIHNQLFYKVNSKCLTLLKMLGITFRIDTGIGYNRQRDSAE